MQHLIQNQSIAQVKQELIEAWDLLKRLRQQQDRLCIGGVILQQQRKVEQLMGHLVLRGGCTSTDIAALVGIDQIGDCGMRRMTIKEYLAHYRGFPAWFQKNDDFHLISQAEAHTPRLDQDSTGRMCHVEYRRALDGQFCVTEATATALVDMGGSWQTTDV